MGAAGRDFHNFNILYRDNPRYKVVAFTAAQIPGISGRRYPPELAGTLYPDGIPIYDEAELPKLIRKYGVEEVVLSYSDLEYSDVMRIANRVLSNGANFKLISPEKTMLKAKKRPVIAVTAVRTGAGKSTVSRHVVSILLRWGLKPIVVRHPMPYEDLSKSAVIKISSYDDLSGLSIEEREEFEPYVNMGVTAFEGVDYERVLNEAEKAGDIIVWDGGNNDTPFFKPDLYIAVADPTRPGQEIASYPGEINVRMADVVVISKINTAEKRAVEVVERNIREINPDALIIKTEFVIEVDKPELINGKKVLVVEDGPSVTHGEMPFGAGFVAAIKYRASDIVDPRPYAIGIYKEIYKKYTHMKNVLPTVGYNEIQRKELEDMINKIPCDTVILGTPSNIHRYMKINKPVVKVRYRLKEIDGPSLEEVIKSKLAGVSFS